MEIISRPKEVPLITYGSVSKSVAVSLFLKTGVLSGAKLLGYYFGKRMRERHSAIGGDFTVCRCSSCIFGPGLSFVLARVCSAPVACRQTSILDRRLWCCCDHDDGNSLTT